MKPAFIVAYCSLLCVFCALVALTIVLWRPHEMPTLLERYAPCERLPIEGPTQQWLCSKGRVVTLNPDGSQADSGYASARPGVPRG